MVSSVEHAPQSGTRSAVVDARCDDLAVLDVEGLGDRHGLLTLGVPHVLHDDAACVGGVRRGLVAQAGHARVRVGPPRVERGAPDEHAGGLGMALADLGRRVRRVLGVERDQRCDVVGIERAYPRATDLGWRPGRRGLHSSAGYRRHRLAALAIAAALVTACGGSARFVVRDDEGGLLQLDGDEAAARADALRQMEAHCGARGYRIVYDGTGSVSVGGERVPTAEERAASMALASDLPGSMELAGTTSAGGAGVTTGGDLFAHDPSRSDRATTPRVDRRRRIEYECFDDDGAADVEPDAPLAERVRIPAQRFVMGSPESEPRRDPDEGPQLEIDVAAFEIDRTPVTVRAFEARLAEVRAAAPSATILTDAETPSEWPGRCNLGSARDDHPINCVSFDAARAYCRLLAADLPTEAERELAARGGASTAYAWGAELEADRVVGSTGCGMRGCRGGTAVVARSGPRCNALGICDLAGNVWEWTLTEYAPALGAYVARVPADDETPAQPVHRGGSWLDEDPRRFRSAFRGVAYPENGLTGVGFRCVVRE